MLNRKNIALLVVALGLAASCAKIYPKLSAKEEKELGRELKAQVDEQIRKEKKDWKDLVVADYVRRVGANLTAAAGGTKYDYTFTVIRDDRANTFSLPGGHIYVYAGLIKEAENEAELASALAHEIGHVVSGHHASEFSRLKAVSNLEDLAIDAADKKWEKLIAEAAADAVRDGGLLVFTRSDESEADQVGARIMARAGYDPRAMTAFLKRLYRGKEQGRIATLFSTHPAPRTRLERLEETIAKVRMPKNPITDTRDFEAIRDRVDAVALK